MKFTDRVTHLEAEGAYAVLARALELEREGREILHLELGQPDFRTPEHVSQAGIAAIEEGLTRYTPPAGLMKFRELIAEDAGDQIRRPAAAQLQLDVMVELDGQEVHVTMATAVPPDDIASVEVRTESGYSVLRLAE